MKRLAVIALFVLLLIYFCCAVIVPQGAYGVKYALAIHDGSPLKEQIVDSGLHFKIPLLQRFEINYTQPIQPKFLQANGATETPYLSVETFDKHNIALGYDVLLQINDPTAFQRTMATDKNGAIKTLRNQLNQLLSAKIAQQTLIAFLQANAQQTTSNTVIATLNQNLQSKGMKIVALYFTSINIANFERALWIEHMKIEQESALANLKQQTAFLSQSLRAASDDKIANILTQGLAQANLIRTTGALVANQIYTQAYNKDPAFYEFYQNLQLDKKALASRQDILILSTHTPFFSALAPNSNTTPHNPQRG